MSIFDFVEDYIVPIASGGISLAAKEVLPKEYYDLADKFLQSTMGAQIPDFAYGLEKAIDANDQPWYERVAMGVDRALDPGAIVDYGAREVGQLLPESVRNIAPAAGGTIGGAIGSYVPVLGTTAGAAIGAGIGSKIKGDTYTGSFINSGIAALSSYLGKALAGAGAPKGYGGEGLSAAEKSAEAAAIGESMGGFDPSVLSDLPPVESGAEGAYSGMQAAPEESMFNMSNIMKVLDVGKGIGSALSGSPEQQKAAEVPQSMWVNTMFLPEDAQPYRSVSGEKGMSAASKSNLFGDYDFKKKRNYADLALMLKDFEQKEEEKKNA